MGNVEIGIYCCLTALILKEGLQKCFVWPPLSVIWISSKWVILTGCYGSGKAKFAKKNQKPEKV